VFIYLLVPGTFSTPETGDETVFPDAAGLAVVEPETKRPTKWHEDYRIIWEWNLFGTGRGEVPAKEATVTESLPENEDLGLRLVAAGW
jgi:hypothetical protein